MTRQIWHLNPYILRRIDDLFPSLISSQVILIHPWRASKSVSEEIFIHFDMCVYVKDISMYIYIFQDLFIVILEIQLYIYHWPIILYICIRISKYDHNNYWLILDLTLSYQVILIYYYYYINYIILLLLIN